MRTEFIFNRRIAIFSVVFHLVVSKPLETKGDSKALTYKKALIGVFCTGDSGKTSMPESQELDTERYVREAAESRESFVSDSLSKWLPTIIFLGGLLIAYGKKDSTADVIIRQQEENKLTMNSLTIRVNDLAERLKGQEVFIQDLQHQLDRSYPGGRR